MPRKASTSPAKKATAAKTDAGAAFRSCMDLIEECEKAVDAAATVHERRGRLRTLGAAEMLLHLHGSMSQTDLDNSIQHIRKSLTH